MNTILSISYKYECKDLKINIFYAFIHYVTISYHK